MSNEVNESDSSSNNKDIDKTTKEYQDLREVQEPSGSMEIYSSPYPPGKEAEIYERLYPGFLKEVVDLQKKEQEHRHSIDNKRASRNDTLYVGKIFNEFILVFSPLAITLIIIGACVYLAIIKAYEVAIAIVSAGSVIAVVGSIIKGILKHLKDRNE